MGPTPLFSLGILVALVRGIWRAGVVHVAFAREVIPVTAAVLALLMRRPLVVQPHGMLTVGRGRLRAVDPLMIRIVAAADSVLALTEVEAQQLRAWSGQPLPRLVVIGNPPLQGDDDAAAAGDLVVDPESEKAGGDLPELLWVARLAPRKNVAHFVDLARLMDRDDVAARLVVVGPDGGDAALVREADEQLAGLVYEGAILGSEISARIRRSSVFVLTSSDEPWGNGVSTAINEGVPVLVPASAALAPVVERYGAGQVYADGDIADLHLKARLLLRDEQAYASAVAGCMTCREELMRAGITEELLVGIYERLLDGSSEELSSLVAS